MSEIFHLAVYLPIHFAHERNGQTPLNDNVVCVVIYVIYVTL